MRRWVLLLLCAMLFCGSVMAQTVYPQLALGDGYDARLTLTNVDIAARFYLIRALVDDQARCDGCKIGVTGSEAVVYLARGETQAFDITKLGALVSGYLIISPYGGGSDPMVSLVQNYRVGGALQTFTVYPRAEVGTLWRFLLSKASSGSYTGFALVSLVATQWEITVRLYPAGGPVRVATLHYGGHVAKYLEELLAVPVGFVGYVEIETPVPAYLTALRQEDVENGFQVASVVPEKVR